MNSRITNGFNQGAYTARMVAMFIVCRPSLSDTQRKSEPSVGCYRRFRPHRHGPISRNISFVPIAGQRNWSNGFVTKISFVLTTLIPFRDTEAKWITEQVDLPWRSWQEKGRLWWWLFLYKVSLDGISTDAAADSILRCVGVFDTVGSVGLPEELTHKLPSPKSMFGFPNNELGEHIEHAYHALAIDETRLDFVGSGILVCLFFFNLLF